MLNFRKNWKLKTKTLNFEIGSNPKFKINFPNKLASIFLYQFLKIFSKKTVKFSVSILNSINGSN